MTQEHNNSADPLHAKKEAWSGRFSEPVSEFVLRYTQSVSFDKRMAMADIQGSLAHAAMLAKCGVISEQDLADIRRGMATITDEIKTGKFLWQLELEDVHLNIEARLTALIGDAGKRLHTGRSRNDQVATDIRLYLRGEIDEIIRLLDHLQEVLVAQAHKEYNTIMPGFTHMQVAQPVTFGHHMLAYVEMFERDRERMSDLRHRVNRSPLGAAALAGTTYPIDREYSAKLLGFEAVAQNSLDAVSDRDFGIEFTSAASLIMVHISRLSEELVYWISQPFSFVKLPDRFTTGSSIMPQKKNPDVPETARGKCARVVGDLISMAMLMKGLPLAYNKDLQEDKEPVFDAIDTVKDTLRAFIEMMAGVVPNREQMRKAAAAGYPTATDLADYLTRRGVPFRTAHDIVGRVVRHASEAGCDIAELSLDDLRSYSDVITDDVYKVLTLEGSVAARNHVGGTAPNQVLKQVERWEAIFKDRHAKGEA
ncbi:MAG: argininosuccinate lyase [Sutterella sp.]|jgi:argininosuccinate lyase|uniref:argininosuccinate lyase n=1 Tax=Duodenibacillus massiliensis TaxID=1852381 RepID=UPI0023A85159|nr:argininosuccinate lyase [Duodenibacillus massiliensis]MBS5791227.1 argininosuccinate lyase [Sutterella sp.]